MKDFEDAVERIKPTVSPVELERYSEWEEQFGNV
ncbi:MAG: hypothetical protein ACFFD1_13580 [Candidatus Thorarchaeota archaeon]